MSIYYMLGVILRIPLEHMEKVTDLHVAARIANGSLYVSVALQSL